MVGPDANNLFLDARQVDAHVVHCLFLVAARIASMTFK
jgi:hypothetical protein